MAMRMSGLLVLATMLLAGCQPASRSWTVYGQVTGQTSLLPIANQPLVVRQFHRDPRWCPFCEMTSTEVATIRTSSAGRYEFTSNRPGMYGIDAISQVNKYCSVSVGLVSMATGKRQVNLIMQEKSCHLVY